MSCAFRKWILSVRIEHKKQLRCTYIAHISMCSWSSPVPTHPDLSLSTYSPYRARWNNFVLVRGVGWPRYRKSDVPTLGIPREEGSRFSYETFL